MGDIRKIDWETRPPFITSECGFGTYQVVVKVHSIEELHAAHDMIMRAFKEANVLAGVLEAQQA